MRFEYALRVAMQNFDDLRNGAQFHRLIERSDAAFDIIVDGRSVKVWRGDLVITAILLHQRAVRRFEFADGLRSGFCLMAACQDCWVRIGNGQRVRACETVVEPGMEVMTGIVHFDGKSRN